MARLKEIPRNADGTFRRHESPLAAAQRELREQAKRAVGEHADARLDAGPRRSRMTGAEQHTAAPMDRRTQSAQNRRWQSNVRLQAPGRVDRELDRLLHEFDLDPDLEVAILRAAGEYGGDQDALAAGLLDVLRELGEHKIAYEVADAYGWAEDPQTLEGYPELAHVQLLRQLGIDGEDLQAVVEEAHGFDGAPGAFLTAAAFLLDENRQDELLDQLAEALDVQVDEILAAVEQAISDGHLDPDELDGEPAGDGEQDPFGLEARELQDRYGISDDDVNMLREYADEHGGTLTEALEDIAEHEGVSLAQLEQQAASAGTITGGEHDGTGGNDGTGEPATPAAVTATAGE